MLKTFLRLILLSEGSLSTSPRTPDLSYSRQDHWRSKLPQVNQNSVSSECEYSEHPKRKPSSPSDYSQPLFDLRVQSLQCLVVSPQLSWSQALLALSTLQ